MVSTKTSLQWSVLLNDIAKEFRDEDVRIAKQLLYSRYKNDSLKIAEKIAQIKNYADLFLVLQRLNILGIDDTDLLRELLEQINPSLLEFLEEFEEGRQREIREMGSVAGVTHSKNLEPFIGREKAMCAIRDTLCTPTTRIGGVCIAGLPGMGKTRLAREVCVDTMNDGWEVFPVDLKGKDTIDSILPAIMYSLNLIQREKSDSEEDRFRVLHKIKNYKKGRRMILWLDNVDRPLEPDSDGNTNVFRKEFLTFLRDLVDLSTPRVKLIITTLYGIPENEDTLNEVLQTIRLDSSEHCLTLEEASQYIRDYSKERQFTKQDSESLARQCGMCPLLMKMVVGSLQGSEIKVKEMVAKLKCEPSDTLLSLQKRGFAADHKIEAGFRSVVEFLNEGEKMDLIMLAVFPGSFTAKAAATILDTYYKSTFGGKTIDKDVGKFKANNKIEMLQKKNLIETSETTKYSNRKPRYVIHFLIRTYIRDIKMQEDSKVKEWYEIAEKRYVQYYMTRLKKMNELVSSNFQDAMKLQAEDSGNFRNVLKLICDKAGFYGDIQEVASIEEILNILLNANERYHYYKDRAQAEKAAGNEAQFAELRCLEVMQLLEKGYSECHLCAMVNDALHVLSKLPDQTARNVQLAEARCYHCIGDIFFERNFPKESNRYLQRALRIYEKYDDDIEDRMVNLYSSISVTTHKLAIDDSQHTILPSIVKQALTYAKKAYDLRCELNGGSEVHFNTPALIQNMAAFHHDLKNYDKAVSLYKHALKIQSELGIVASTSGFSIMKNVATTYRRMHRFEDALVYATAAMNGRKEILGDTPYTARSVYMVGTIYLEMERLTESRKYLVEALELEERLWRSGKPHSYDWGHLKTRLEEVALLLDLPDTVIYSYKRRFEAAEDKKNFGKPAPRKDFRDKNESSSESSDDDDIPSVDISELVHSNDDLTSLLCSKHWDVTETGVFDPTQYIMIGSYCWLVVIAIGVAMYYMLYSGSQ